MSPEVNFVLQQELMHSMETINELREEIMQLTKQISEQVTKLLFT